MVVRGFDLSKLDYELTNIQLEYEALNDVGLAREVRNAYRNGTPFMYDNVAPTKRSLSTRAQIQSSTRASTSLAAP